MSVDSDGQKTEEIVEAVIEGMLERKGKDIVVLDMRKIDHAISDFFVICHGDSTTQVDAIGRSIEEQTLKDLNEKPWHREGFENAQWVLLDFVNVVAHVFHKDYRDFYALEELWADAEIREVDEVH